jgi:branched-chain amino acid transport system permease protein
MFEQLILNGLIAGSIYSFVALGFALIYQTTRFFPCLCFSFQMGRHFAHGAVYTFGAYTSASLSAYFAYLFSIQLGLDRLIAFPIACLATTLIGVGREVGIYKPMRKRKATDLTLLILHYRTYL